MGSKKQRFQDELAEIRNGSWLIEKVRIVDRFVEIFLQDIDREVLTNAGWPTRESMTRNVGFLF